MAQFTKGARFRSRRDLGIKGIITFAAPFSDGFEGVFPADEVLVLDNDPHPSARGMWLAPERYDHFETMFVPSRDRAHEDYGGYAIAVDYDQIGKDVEVLP